jgi:hypothetical protein
MGVCDSQYPDHLLANDVRNVVRKYLQVTRDSRRDADVDGHRCSLSGTVDRREINYFLSFILLNDEPRDFT